MVHCKWVDDYERNVEQISSPHSSNDYIALPSFLRSFDVAANGANFYLDNAKEKGKEQGI